jgi:hypothetical protein
MENDGQVVELRPKEKRFRKQLERVPGRKEARDPDPFPIGV